ncbi:polysaccharide deacetylase family protein [Micrococcus sp.]|uniref:polysaccharide deacetylase family protein n=1 Tax=Micrococcus sp. TaxID=1271 RepID=UPI002A90A7EE|nr:polysaccharide deacetylase family protein [Micrococcus sp.]MDY6055058.1 polysaccharide deacetylase family protein [Micrococcus sp.]
MDRRGVLAAGSAALAGLMAACAPPPQDAPATGSAAPDPTTPAPSSSASATPTPSPTFTDTDGQPAPKPAGAPVPWSDPTAVPHLFVHACVVDPARGFGTSAMAEGNLNYKITVAEFKRILPRLWSRGFVIVSPHELYETLPDGTIKAKTIMVPENRTPLLFSVDDLNYPAHQKDAGLATRMLVDTDGRVRTEYVDADGTAHIGAHDVVPVMDDFMDNHPEFSLTGHRGVSALTGNSGVFGYRSSVSLHADSPTFAEDVKAATAVAEAMKATGWEFSSHSWSHHAIPKMSLAELREDCDLWEKDVQPILGATDLMIFPFGWDLVGTGTYEGAHYQELHSRGFRAYFNVNPGNYTWGQFFPAYWRGARINVDGITMGRTLRGEADVLTPFFDTAEVVDPSRPPSISAPGYKYVSPLG